jgi:hypothetical protein
MHGSQSASQVRWQTVDSARRFWPNVNHNGYIISGKSRFQNSQYARRALADFAAVGERCIQNYTD